MKNVLITGATGFLGNILVQKLYDRKYKVFILARAEENISSIQDKASIYITDYSSESLRNVFPKNIDVVIHLAWAGVNGPDKGNDIVQNSNVEIALKVAEVAKEKTVKRFIGIGTITELAYLDNLNNNSPSITYGKYKYKCYKTLSDFFTSSAVSFIWLRLANIYGYNNLSGNILGYTFQKLLNNQEAEFGPCDQYYDFVFIDDEINAIILFLSNNKVNKDIFYLGTGLPRLLRGYIECVGKLLNREQLIKIGARKSDGIVFRKDIFDSSDAFDTIGNYISDSFENRIIQLKNMLMR